MCLELDDERSQFGLIVGQHLVVQALSGPIEGDGMMMTFADSTPMNASTELCSWFSCIGVYAG